MSEHQHAPDVFEESDWEMKPVVVTVIALFIFLAIGIVFGEVTIRLAAVKADALETTEFYGNREVPAPRLQVDEPADLRAFHEKEEAKLNSYQMIDPDRGAVRIPIERAIELTAEEAENGR